MNYVSFDELSEYLVNVLYDLLPVIACSQINDFFLTAKNTLSIKNFFEIYVLGFCVQCLKLFYTFYLYNTYKFLCEV